MKSSTYTAVGIAEFGGVRPLGMSGAVLVTHTAGSSRAETA